MTEFFTGLTVAAALMTLGDIHWRKENYPVGAAITGLLAAIAVASVNQ